MDATPKQPETSQKAKVGLLMIFAGAVLCLLGFIAVVTYAQEGTALNVALYGITGTGGTALMGGLFLLVG